SSIDIAMSMEAAALLLPCRPHAGRNEDNSKTNPHAAGGNLTLVAVGGAAEPGVEVPRAAAEHTGVALSAFRIFFRGVLVVVLVKGVSAPLADVAMHVIKAPGVGLETVHRRGERIAVVPVHEAVVAIGLGIKFFLQ